MIIIIIIIIYWVFPNRIKDSIWISLPETGFYFVDRHFLGEWCTQPHDLRDFFRDRKKKVTNVNLPCERRAGVLLGQPVAALWPSGFVTSFFEHLFVCACVHVCVLA